MGGAAAVTATYWRIVGSNGLGANGCACSEMRLWWGGAQQSLVGLTFTALGAFANASYPLSKVNDGVIEVVNGTNIALCTSATWDASVTLAAPQAVTGVDWAPQGTQNSQFYDTPTTLTLYSGTSPTGPWTQAQTWTGYTVGTGGGSFGANGQPGVPAANWNPGSFRHFDITGTVNPP